MTVPNNTTYKLIGLAATGAAMLGMNLEDALCTDPAELARTIDAYLTRHTATAATAAAAEEPAGHTTPVAEPPTQPRPAAPVAEERTRLIRPGMTIPAGDVDPEDESLYI